MKKLLLTLSCFGLMGCFGSILPHGEYYEADAKDGQPIIVYLNVAADIVEAENQARDQSILEKDGYVLIGHAKIDDIHSESRCKNIFQSQANMIKASKIYIYKSKNENITKIKKNPFQKTTSNTQSSYKVSSETIYSAFYYAKKGPAK